MVNNWDEDQSIESQINIKTLLFYRIDQVLLFRYRLEYDKYQFS